MAIYNGITKLPYEVYPIMFMISCALGFGTYVASNKLAFDQSLRIRKDRGIPDWADRLRKPSGSF